MTKEIALIVRWHGKATDAGARLLALSCFDSNRFVSGENAILDDVMSFQALNHEFTIEVIDVLHEYCFILRKLIERADKVAQAKKLMPHTGQRRVAIRRGGADEREVELCNQDLWWILGRVIHSRSVFVVGGDYSNLVVYDDAKTREFEDGRCYVEVLSDFDEQDEQGHIVHIPSLVRTYTFSSMSNEIQDIVRANSM